MVREAVEAFISGEEWAKAKKVARELEPRLEALVDEKYKHNLRNKGNAEQLADVDLISALDMYVEQGNWSKAIATASGHGPEVTSSNWIAMTWSWHCQFSSSHRHDPVHSLVAIAMSLSFYMNHCHGTVSFLVANAFALPVL